ncbi:PAS domain-containing protein [Formosa haliotis]|uniref:PAS domain-containing protein n=1 Tax=Formosa haliotis TaxID=1555194 RepID=UPI000824DEF5|nr:PAS domain-containing protein [Formosa haliotis]
MNNVLVSNLDFFVQQDFFSRKIIDHIPGTFYVYKKHDDVFKLFACNKHHLDVSGYTAEESINQEPFFFVDRASMRTIHEGVQDIKNQNYAKQVYANILTKKGELIPFVFEGYGFTYRDEEYFMGVGTDISDLTKAHVDLKNERLQRDKNEKELIALALSNTKKEAVLSSISSKLDLILQQSKSEGVAKDILKLTKDVKASLAFSKDNWQKFELLFKNLHGTFYKNLLLSHPNLTKTEMSYCALLKLRMSKEQICNTLNISREGLKKKKFRLKKKLNLEKHTKLEQYIIRF